MKKIIFLASIMVAGNAPADEELVGIGGSLKFESEVDGAFESVYFEPGLGRKVALFDIGLLFYYSPEALSPDKAKSVLQFSESGVLEDDSGNVVGDRSNYMCAFVRMTDGCVVQVAEGEVCGGQWNSSSGWDASTYSNENIIFEGGPSVADLYKKYSSKRKVQLAGGKSLVSSYLQEGTSMENVFSCDPLDSSNKDVYLKLLDALQEGGDLESATKVKSLLN